jgi:hypothetical protein
MSSSKESEVISLSDDTLDKMERKMFEEYLIKNESFETVPDDPIKLGFKKEIIQERIKNLFLKLRIKHRVEGPNIYIQRNELDKTAPIFQEKVLKF